MDGLEFNETHRTVDSFGNNLGFGEIYFSPK